MATKPSTGRDVEPTRITVAQFINLEENLGRVLNDVKRLKEVSVNHSGLLKELLQDAANSVSKAELMASITSTRYQQLRGRGISTDLGETEEDEYDGGLSKLKKLVARMEQDNSEREKRLREENKRIEGELNKTKKELMAVNVRMNDMLSRIGKDHSHHGFSKKDKDHHGSHPQHRSTALGGGDHITHSHHSSNAEGPGTDMMTTVSGSSHASIHQHHSSSAGLTPAAVHNVLEAVLEADANTNNSITNSISSVAESSNRNNSNASSVDYASQLSGVLRTSTSPTNRPRADSAADNSSAAATFDDEDEEENGSSEVLLLDSLNNEELQRQEKLEWDQDRTEQLIVEVLSGRKKAMEKRRAGVSQVRSQAREAAMVAAQDAVRTVEALAGSKAALFALGHSYFQQTRNPANDVRRLEIYKDWSTTDTTKNISAKSASPLKGIDDAKAKKEKDDEAQKQSSPQKQQSPARPSNDRKFSTESNSSNSRRPSVASSPSKLKLDISDIDDSEQAKVRVPSMSKGILSAAGVGTVEHSFESLEELRQLQADVQQLKEGMANFQGLVTEQRQSQATAAAELEETLQMHIASVKATLEKAAQVQAPILAALQAHFARLDNCVDVTQMAMKAVQALDSEHSALLEAHFQLEANMHSQNGLMTHLVNELASSVDTMHFNQRHTDSRLDRQLQQFTQWRTDVNTKLVALTIPDKRIIMHNNEPVKDPKSFLPERKSWDALMNDLDATPAANPTPVLPSKTVAIPAPVSAARDDLASGKTGTSNSSPAGVQQRKALTKGGQDEITMNNDSTAPAAPALTPNAPATVGSNSNSRSDLKAGLSSMRSLKAATISQLEGPVLAEGQPEADAVVTSTAPVVPTPPPPLTTRQISFADDKDKVNNKPASQAPLQQQQPQEEQLASLRADMDKLKEAIDTLVVLVGLGDNTARTKTPSSSAGGVFGGSGTSGKGVNSGTLPSVLNQSSGKVAVAANAPTTTTLALPLSTALMSFGGSTSGRQQSQPPSVASPQALRRQSQKQVQSPALLATSSKLKSAGLQSRMQNLVPESGGGGGSGIGQSSSVMDDVFFREMLAAVDFVPALEPPSMNFGNQGSQKKQGQGHHRKAGMSTLMQRIEEQLPKDQPINNNNITAADSEVADDGNNPSSSQLLQPPSELICSGGGGNQDDDGDGAQSVISDLSDT